VADTLGSRCGHDTSLVAHVDVDQAWPRPWTS
jgi:hypothetical protein